MLTQTGRVLFLLPSVFSVCSHGPEAYVFTALVGVRVKQIAPASLFAA